MNFFTHQDDARRNTRHLVILFSLAVLSLVLLTNILFIIVIGFFNPEQLANVTSMETAIETINWDIFLLIGVGVVTLIILGSVYKVISLSGGGARIAEMLFAEPVIDAGNDFNKQKLLNVVAEMAIASGTPVPPVYLLEEKGINAFAAGYTPGDAIIGVTRGAIEQLSREQLQGVIAHEFSHILNGDMRLNIRLIGILHGILLIGLIGHTILRSVSYSRRSKGSGGIAALGLGLMIIGYAGTFFGKLIKAGVSRQREYLADASAVQYTRNPDGIAGALKRIGGYIEGSTVIHPGAEQISHALFGEGGRSITGLYATHPPLEKRIYRIQPNWDGEFDYSKPIIEREPVTAEPAPVQKKAATMAAIAAAMTTGTLDDYIGQPTADHLTYAHELLNDLPENFVIAVSDAFAARAVIYYLVLDKDPEQRQAQLQHLQSSADTGVYEEVQKLLTNDEGIRTEYRLPLLDLALSTLHQLSKSQYQLFKDNLNTLIELDKKITLFEWSIRKIVFHYLDPVFLDKPKRTPKPLTLKQTADACAILLSLLIYTGKEQHVDEQATFAAANEFLGQLPITLIGKSELKLDSLNNAMDTLARLKPLEKPRLLKACAVCITADNQLSVKEVELFRAVSAIIDCPMPPLILTKDA